MTVNEMKCAVFFANWQPGEPKYNWVSQTITNTDIPGRNTHFQRRITDCSIVFQINKYVNLACFLNICKHIMVFLCFSRVKILHTAPLTFSTCFHVVVAQQWHGRDAVWGFGKRTVGGARDGD